MIKNKEELSILLKLIRSLKDTLGAEINMSQVEILLETAMRHDGNDQWTVMDYVKNLDISQTSASRNLFSLAGTEGARKKGLGAIEQYYNDGDRRSKYHKLTNRGENIINQITDQLKSAG